MTAVFEAALQKAVRSLEQGNSALLWEAPEWRGMNAQSGVKHLLDSLPLYPNDLRLWAVAAALRRGATRTELVAQTSIDPWFIAPWSASSTRSADCWAIR